MNDPCYAPAHRLATLLRDRQASAVELLAQHEARLARVNPGINAVIATDFDAARERARQADAAIARGEWWGPLHGVPMTVKDTWEVAGFTTCCGAPALKDYRPKVTAPAVQRLLDAGAVIFGKTNTPLYASDVQTFNKVYGTTNNPWNRDRTPGGSSGGAAAAVAAGLTPLELGSDIGGSIRTPAHFCGVFGHKATYGLIPMRGHVPGPPGTLAEADLAVAGPLARSAEDLALGLSVAAGPLAAAGKAWRLALPAPRQTRLQDFRVQVWLDDAFAPLDAPMRAVLDATVERLRQAGCAVTTGAPAGLSLEAVYADYFLLLGAVFGPGLPPKVYRRARLAAAVARKLGRARPNTTAGFAGAATVSHSEWLRAVERRERLRARLETFFDGVDVLLMPVAPTAAPPHNQRGTPYERTITIDGASAPYAAQFNWISLATLTGLPATAAPVGRTADGLPVGVQIVGAGHEDLTTIEFARLLAQATGGFEAPP